MILYGPDKPFDAPAPTPSSNGKRKGGVLADNEIHAFTNITNAAKDIAYDIIREKQTDMHPDLYQVVMDIVGFIDGISRQLLATSSTTRPMAPASLACVSRT
jgi:hypothetical protein